ncbi:MAG: DMT family transporter, partial [Clostridiales bacterium]|nr:DMT family transporter [Clostridiales bacterium]
MKAEKLKNSLLLVLVALIWGVAFVAQSEGAKDVGPYTFNAVRMIIGGLVLLPCIKIMDAFRAKEPDAPREKGGKALWLGGLCCGVVLFLASTLQQVGILYTTAGKA